MKVTIQEQAMTSTLAPTPAIDDRPTGVRRFGYTLAIAINAVLLWLVNQFLAWEWPGFLTESFEQVLPLLSASLVANMVVNAGFLARDRGWFRALGDLVNAAFALAVSIRMWHVFPFDFTGYDRDWTGLFRLALGIGIAGAAIALLANLVKLVQPADEPTA